MKTTIPTVMEIQAEPQGEAGIVLSLENLIKSHIESIEKLSEERKKYKEMLESAFMNDTVYQEHHKIAQAAIKIRLATKQQILKQQQNINFTNKVKDISNELKDKKSALSDYLLEYKRMTKANQLELFNGETVAIVETAKIIKVKGK